MTELENRELNHITGVKSGEPKLPELSLHGPRTAHISHIDEIVFPDRFGPSDEFPGD